MGEGGFVFLEKKCESEIGSVMSCSLSISFICKKD